MRRFVLVVGLLAFMLGDQALAAAADLTLKSEPGNPVVGTPTVFSGQVTLNGNGQPGAVPVTIKIMQLEENAAVLQTALVAPDGRFTFAYNFWDGAPHRIIVSAATPEGAVEKSLDVAVAGISPPLTLRLRILAELLVVMGIGAFLGYRLSGRTQQLANVSPKKRAAG